jgi:hypothetical protein
MRLPESKDSKKKGARFCLALMPKENINGRYH